MAELKLYVWEGVLPESEGLAVAIAYNQDQALEMVVEKWGVPLDKKYWDDCKVYDLNTPIAFVIG